MSRTPTPQQKTVIATVIETVLTKVEACAGSGKTSTLIMCAEALPVASLYLAFNKVTAEEGTAKFPNYVKCQTTHSLAYRACAGKIAHKLSRPQGKYQNVAGTGSEIARMYSVDSIKIDEDLTLTGNFIGLLARLTLSRFEQSADLELDISHTTTGDMAVRLHAAGATAYVKKVVLAVAKRLWADRINPSSVVLATHDTYLKMYQMSKPVLTGFEVLYVDEFQDTTPCVLDIVMHQSTEEAAKKRGKGIKIVMVGDARQAIYGWRGAVNAMLMVEAPTVPLTKSFRYGQAVADVATAILEGGMVITGNEALKTVAGPAFISGLIDEKQHYTRLFRTNSALLTAAVSALREGKKIAIEIDVKDFVKLLESAEALFNNEMKNVKHDKLLPYPTWEEAKAEAKHDAELKRVVKLIEENKGQEYIAILTNFRSASDPQVTFTTAHKSKGREWLQVRVEDDFKDGYEDGEWVGLSVEEQNLLYVACTRAQAVLEYCSVVGEYINRYLADGEFTSASVDKLMATLAAEGPGNGHDFGGGLRGEQAQYAAEEQEEDRWA